MNIKDKSLQVQKGTTLVAIVKNATIRKTMNSDICTYEEVSINNTSTKFNSMVSLIIVAIAIASAVVMKLKKID